jgi:hypothetical protein
VSEEDVEQVIRRRLRERREKLLRRVESGEA